MDGLAAEGIRFTDAHSPSAVCTPSRYGVLTGRYCWRSPLKHNVFFGYEPPLIEPGRQTVAAVLKDAGYDTACIGKWHLGLGYSAKPGKHLDFDAPLPWGNANQEFEESIDFTKPLTGGPVELGFDYFFGTSGCSTCQPPYGFIENDSFCEIPNVYREKCWFTGRPGMTTPGWDDKLPDPTFARKATEYIEQHAGSDKPFFLYLATSSPHEPCLVDVVPEFARGKSAAGPRGDMVWLVDWVVGQMVEVLDRTGLAENTLIMVTSDNGALPGDRKQNNPEGNTVDALYHTYGHKSCGDWRGYKAHIWEGGHREPLIARWPGMIKPNTVSDQLVGLTDFLATCAAITDSELPDETGEDSMNILPILLGEQTEKALRSDLIFHSQAGVFSIRRKQWKCIFDTQGSGGWPPPWGGGPVPDTRGQLYNMVDDPLEQENLWDERQDIVVHLRGLLERYQELGRSVPHRTTVIKRQPKKGTK